MVDDSGGHDSDASFDATDDNRAVDGSALLDVNDGAIVVEGGLAEACTTDFESISWHGEHCLSTYDEMLDYIDDCTHDLRAPYRFALRCDNDTYMVVISFGTHSTQCFYGGESKELEGAIMEDDVASFCDYTSPVMVAGVINVCDDSASMELRRSCSP